MKTCNLCKLTKPKTEFGYRKDGKDGLHARCKPCIEESESRYSKSLKTLVTAIYSKQRSKSKDRKHPNPSYTKIELMEYILEHPNFESIYKAWINSNYNSWYKPSIDRIDISLGYSFDNIRLVTWRENHQAQKRLTSIPIYRIDRYSGRILSEYDSIMDACRKHGLESSSLSAVVKLDNGKIELGSIWMSKNEYNEENYKKKQLRTNRFVIAVVINIDIKIEIRLYKSIEDALNFIRSNSLYSIKSSFTLTKLIQDVSFPYIFKAIENDFYMEILNKIKEKEYDSKILDIVNHSSKWYTGK
jgi:hypothetical protein